jgi:hypothetical protein
MIVYLSWYVHEGLLCLNKYMPRDLSLLSLVSPGNITLSALGPEVASKLRHLPATYKKNRERLHVLRSLKKKGFPTYNLAICI